MQTLVWKWYDPRRQRRLDPLRRVVVGRVPVERRWYAPGCLGWYTSHRRSASTPLDAQISVQVPRQRRCQSATNGSPIPRPSRDREPTYDNQSRRYGATADLRFREFRIPDSSWHQRTNFLTDAAKWICYSRKKWSQFSGLYLPSRSLLS